MQRGENRMLVADENRGGPDPRNVAVVREWDIDRQRLVDVTRNYEERDAFVSDRTSDGAFTWRQHFPVDARTVGEIRRGGLRDVPVICPRRVVLGEYTAATPGQVLSWARAVELGIVEG